MLDRRGPCRRAGQLTPLRAWVTQRTRLTFVGGQITNNGTWMGGTLSQASTDGLAREQINSNWNGITGSLVYTYRRSAPKPARRMIRSWSLALISVPKAVSDCATRTRTIR